MKLMTIGFCLFLSLVATAGEVIVTPYNPADCSTKKYESVNWIYNLEKKIETDNEIVFSFNTKHGSCDDSKIDLRKIKINKLTLTLFEDGIHIPFKKRPAQIRVEHFASEFEATVTVTIDKKVAFKNKDTRTFIMTFLPLVSYQFDWKVMIKKDTNNVVNFSFVK